MGASLQGSWIYGCLVCPANPTQPPTTKGKSSFLQPSLISEIWDSWGLSSTVKTETKKLPSNSAFLYPPLPGHPYDSSAAPCFPQHSFYWWCSWCPLQDSISSGPWPSSSYPYIFWQCSYSPPTRSLPFPTSHKFLSSVWDLLEAPYSSMQVSCPLNLISWSLEYTDPELGRNGA